MRFLLLFILTPLFLLAHPHVFVDVEIDVTLDKTSAEVKVIWRFDEMTSSMLLMDFDTNMDGKLDKKESLFLKQEAFDHLEPLGYYTTISAGGKIYKPSFINDFTAYFEGNQMLYEFSFVFPFPQKLQKLNIGCYDEDNLVAFFLSSSVNVSSREQDLHIAHESKRENRDYYDASILFISWRER